MTEIILGIEFLHKQGIIFRDLKPENVVLDSEGHAIITDFGLSKEGVGEGKLAKSFCGSYAYLAPEMVLKKGHDYSLDWYLVGVMLYELLESLPPYYDTNRETLMKNIISN
jgi:serine/threonine protein kinase